MSSSAGTLAVRGQVNWLVVLAALGVFFAADDQTSVVAILPDMISGVGLAQDQFYRAAWIVNGYILGYVVAMPLMGRVADTYGCGRVFAASMLLFCAGSAWVAASSGLTMLSIARAVQAVGGGAVVPVSMAIVASQVAPSRRAMGLGAIAAASEVGALVGPLWGGGIAEVLGWRGVFWVNLPMCLPIAASVFWLSRDERRSERRSLDLLGAALIGASLVFLSFALTDDPISQRPAWLTVLLYLAAFCLFGLFLIRQSHARSPIVDLHLFQSRRICSAFLVNCFAGGALIVAMVGVPLFTNVVLEDSALRGGLNLMRLTIALPVGALAGGYLAIRLGLASTAMAGLFMAGAGFLGMSTWSAQPSFIELTAPLLVAGLGFGLIIAPINEAVMGRVDADYRATMASLLTVVRLLGALVGVALLTTRGLGSFYAEAGLIRLDDPLFGELLRGLQVDAFQDTFVVTAIVCFLTALPAYLISRDRPERGAEATEL